jgi:hypothetical protein
MMKPVTIPVSVEVRADGDHYIAQLGALQGEHPTAAGAVASVAERAARWLQDEHPAMVLEWALQQWAAPVDPIRGPWCVHWAYTAEGPMVAIDTMDDTDPLRIILGGLPTQEIADAACLAVARIVGRPVYDGREAW